MAVRPANTAPAGTANAPAPATNATPPQGARPGATVPQTATSAAAPVTAPREKVVRTPWGTRDQEGQLVQKLTTADTPADFNPKTHKPLGRPDFADLATYYDFRAKDATRRATEFTQLAHEERTGEGKETRAKQKRALRLKDQYEALLKELASDGVDVAAVMGQQAQK